LVYSWAIPAQTYKLLGRKELLMPRHQDIPKVKELHKEGQCLYSGLQRERIKTYVLECIHKDPNYLYSKQIWYLDPETWWIIYSDKYDKRGRMWKIFDMGQRVVKSVYNDSQIPVGEFTLVIDVQRHHATGALSYATIGQTDVFFEPEYYTPRALQKWGY
jgi:hypothetical protein